MRPLMNKIIVILIAVAINFVGCDTESKTSSNNNNTIEEVSNNGNHAAKVEDKIEAGNYTYLHVTENDETYWIAVTRMDIEVGEMVYFSQSMEMKNFKSESLNRTFESVLFVQDAGKFPNQKAGDDPHNNLTSLKDEQISIESHEGNKTVEQIYNEKESLNGKIVKVKGKVVKFNPNIMNRNWIHLQDGTGDETSFDLVVTSQHVADVGDIITAEGIVTNNKDFGSGYFFPVIVEEAKIVK
ncbi:MAG: hypothetical protein DRQ13_09845 [Ignavibacteriae bacterium]|nr:MAG: hypothetical protein DRQ13_09845 [Ignavibacteriota bacterium]